MSTIPPVPTVPKVRTFAADLTATRKIRGDVLIPPVTTTASPVRTLPTKPVPPVPQKLKVVPKPLAPAPTVFITKAVPVAPPTIATPADEKPIPPFHTLAKAAQHSEDGITKIDTSEFNATAKIAKPSVLANPGTEQLSVTSKDPIPGDSGTIITDTKHKRFSLIGAISESLHGWWGEKKHAAKQRKIPKYTVPEAERRKGVIQKATTQTGRTSTSDHAAVMSRIKFSQKTLRHSSVPSETTVGAAATSETTNVDSFIKIVTPPSATDTSPIFAVPGIIAASEAVIAAEPFAETLTADVPITPIESALPLPIVQFVIKPVIPAVPIPQPPIIPNIPEIPTVPEIASEEENLTTKTIAERLQELENEAALAIPTAPPVPERVLPVEAPMPRVTPIERPRITPTIPKVETVVVPEEVPQPIPPVIPSEPTAEIRVDESTIERPNWSLNLSNQKASPFAFLQHKTWVQTIFAQTNRIALGLASGVGVVLVLWFGGQALIHWRNTSTTPTAVRTGALFSDSMLIATNTPLRTKTEFIETFRRLQGTSDSFSEMILTDPVTHAPISAAALFDLMNARRSSSLTAAITHVYLGTYHDEPWIILESGDVGAVQGGLLAWENTLDTDFTPWFSTTTIRTTKRGITLFHDDVIAGHDVRILTDITGHERIVYGFVTPTKALITTSPTAFLNLAEKSRAIIH